MKPDVAEARVTISNQQSAPVDVEMLHVLAERVLDHEGLPSRCEISVALVSDERMAELNSAHLDRVGPTDVLAFPLVALVPGALPTVAPSAPPLVLGDLFIAPDYVSRQAESLGVGHEDELCLMLVHGILHLLGYDHVEGGDAEVMEARERDLLATVGVERR